VPGMPINPKTGKPAFGPTRGVIPCLEFIAAMRKLDPSIRVTPSVWSPPAWMKTTGRPSGGGALKPECYAHFARYLVEWVSHVKERYGIDIYALSPQNELEFPEPYDSCQYTPEQYRDVVKTIGTLFRKERIDIKLFGPEDMTHYGPRTVRFVAAIADDPAAKPFLDIVATHGYADGIQLTGSVQENEAFWNLIKGYGKPYWQTETGTGAADSRWNDGGPDGKTTDRKTGQLLPGALSSVGGRLHYALAYGNASAWLFWQITGPQPDIHSLMVLDQPTKKYYVAKHFYRWIRPGAVRIGAGPDGGDNGLCVSAYEHAKNKTVTIVLLNRSHDNVRTTLNLKTSAPLSSFETHRTSEAEDCVALPPTAVADGKAILTLPPRSIVTLYSKAD
jgi:O-glycosyl hydrolase